MKNHKKDDILIGLLKQVETDSPSIDLTDSVMDQLDMNFEKELNSNPVFTSLLKKENELNLSANFTSAILSSISDTQSKTYLRPILDKKAIVLFTSSIVGLSILSFFIGENTQLSQEVKTYNYNFLNILSNSLSQESSILFICIISICFLLIIDYTLKNRFSYLSNKVNT